MSKIIVYQILVRLFGNKRIRCMNNGSRKQNGTGKFIDITDKALQEIKNMGVSHIWFTGVIEHAIVEGYPSQKIPNGNPSIIKGMAGSPYAIKDYYDVNPDLAVRPRKRMQEWENLIERTHRNRLKVLIDFVPNHIAREYYSDQKRVEINNFGDEDKSNIAFSHLNDFYYIPNRELVLPENSGTKVLKKNISKPYKEFPAKATGNDKFSNHLDINDWYETVKLNYGIDYQNDNKKHFEPIPPVWWKMSDIFQFWTNKGVDGFRCDMADMVPVEFWEWVIPQIKEKNPQIIFIGEIYKPALYRTYLQEGLFDYLYDKVGTYDTLRNVMQHGADASMLTDCWKKLEGINDKMLRFLENHDEQRIASTHFLGNPFHAIPGVILSATFHNGPVLIYFGQEVGEPAIGASGFSGDDGKTTIFDYWKVPEHQKWMNDGRFDGEKLSKEQRKLRLLYVTILNFCQKNKVFSSGNFYDLMWANHHPVFNQKKLYTYLRYNDKKRYLIVLNFDRKNTQEFKIYIPEHAFECMGIEISTKLLLKSILNDSNQKLTAKEIKEKGIHLTLEAHSGSIFEIIFCL